MQEYWFLNCPNSLSFTRLQKLHKPERGFNPNIMHELRHKVKEFSDKEILVVLLMDEMKMQENLEWDKHNGEL